MAVNHQNNFATNLTSGVSATDTTSPLNSIPTIDAPFYLAFDATNINGNYEVVYCTSKTSTNVNHAALANNHTTAEEVRCVCPAAEMDTWSAALDTTTWTSYNPTWTLTGAASQNGTKTGAYTQIGKTVFFWAKFVVAADSNFAGLSSIFVSLPVTASSSFDDSSEIGFVKGGGQISSGYYPFSSLGFTTTSVHLVISVVSGINIIFSDITGTAPATWGLGDKMFVSGFFEAA